MSELQGLSIVQLADIDVSSVTKTPQTLNQAPAAIYVITHDDIARSGAYSMPEILRLAPNLQVYQTSASQYVVTARGFNGNASDQNFSNKLLVLIDGRTVYSPLYSGVYWDVQDVPPGDIDRIEVISGPGATLWGANAVNGVINIVTRSSAQTQGGDVDIHGGDFTTGASLRYGGKLGQGLTWRLYAMTQADRDTQTPAGANAVDHWQRPQGGFRADWTASAADSLTVQGDGYNGVEAQGAGAPDQAIAGANVLGRWTHSWQGGASLQVQAYYDLTQRGSDVSGNFTLNTYDLDVQHNFSWGPNQLVWGGGFRSSRYRINSAGSLIFLPASRTLDLANLFAQDSLAITPTLKLIVGLKLEDDPYVGLSPLPDVRLTWTPGSTAMVWAAASYAVRSPTPFDRDVVEKSGAQVFLTGAGNFQPEQVTAYEFGGRFQPLSRLSLSVSAYYNEYHDLRSIEPHTGGFLPLQWGNGMQGQTWGLESWAEVQATAWWRLSGSLNLMRHSYSFETGASGLLGVVQAADDPQQLASLKSSMNLGHGVTLDANLRYVDALPSPSVPAYTELGDGRAST